MRKSAGMLTVVILGFAAVACSRVESANEGEAAHHKFVLVGSTACDAEIKAQLSIPLETKCDFIRWKLTLDRTRGETFTLDANYGEAQPNTKGFIGGGQWIRATGKFEFGEPALVSTDSLGTPAGTLHFKTNSNTNAAANSKTTQGAAGNKREYYWLSSNSPRISVNLLKVNENLYHLVNSDESLMVGNGGWSYTLNRAPAIANAPMPASGGAKLAQVVFEGRTPCKEIAEIIKLAADPDCFKMKWRVTLERDGKFTMDTTLNRQETIRGTWSESNGVLRFSQGFSLWVADENVVFFLDKNDRPLVGNEDFSYTLNRRGQ